MTPKKIGDDYNKFSLYVLFSLLCTNSDYPPSDVEDGGQAGDSDSCNASMWRSICKGLFSVGFCRPDIGGFPRGTYPGIRRPFGPDPTKMILTSLLVGTFL